MNIEITDKHLYEGVNFLHFLKNKYTDEFNSEYACSLVCPYDDIKERYVKKCDSLRSDLSEINSKICDYESAHMELERITILNEQKKYKVNIDSNTDNKYIMSGDIDDMKNEYTCILCLRKKRDIEDYNKRMYMAYVFWIMCESLYKFINKNEHIEK